MYSPRLTKSDIFCNGSQSKVKSLHLLITLGERMPFNNLLTTAISQQRRGQELSDTMHSPFAYSGPVFSGGAMVTLLKS